MSSTTFQITTGGQYEERTVGFVVGDQAENIAALYIEFQETYQFPAPFAGTEDDITDWWEENAKAGRRARRDGLAGQFKEDQFVAWLIIYKNFQEADIWEVVI